MASIHFFLVQLLIILVSKIRIANSASVQIDKDFYCQGETITVDFSDVQGEGIWIGLYLRDDISDFSNLPDWESDTLKSWILTCGVLDTCFEWPADGQVQLSTSDLSANDYVLVVSEDRAALSAQAFTDPFVIETCDVPALSPVQNALPEAPTSPEPAPSPVTFDQGAIPAPSPIQSALPEVGISPDTPAPTEVSNAGVETDPPVLPASTPQPTQDPLTVTVLSDDAFLVIEEARFQIIDLIRADNDLIGKFIRLVFHDCVGGCDGCVDMTNPSHNGLAKPIAALSPIVNNFGPRGLSRTDVWMLAGLAAIDVALPADQRDILFGLQWIGRKTCEAFGDCGNDSEGNPSVCAEMAGPHVEMCHATSGTTKMQTFFEEEFGFTAQQITALMGAHSVGSMFRENSGFQGNWDLSKTVLDAGYWIELDGQPPNFFLQDINNDDLPGIPNQRQWLGIINQDSTVAMLNTDMALVRNVGNIEDGITCDFNGPNPCSQDTPFMPHVKRYLADTRTFILDFRDVFNLLIDHGHFKAGECPGGRICSFGFLSPDTFTSEAQPAPSPVSPPVAPPTFHIPGDGEAKISVDKSCYSSGEMVVASFENISGTGVKIGIFQLSAISAFPQLPDFEGDEVREWIFSCGNPNCHTWLSQGGVQLSTSNLEDGDYAAVISGDQGSTTGQAATSFRIGSC